MQKLKPPVSQLTQPPNHHTLVVAWFPPLQARPRACQAREERAGGGGWAAGGRHEQAWASTLMGRGPQSGPAGGDEGRAAARGAVGGGAAATLWKEPNTAEAGRRANTGACVGGCLGACMWLCMVCGDEQTQVRAWVGAWVPACGCVWCVGTSKRRCVRGWVPGCLHVAVYGVRGRANAGACVGGCLGACMWLCMVCEGGVKQVSVRGGGGQ